MPNAIAATMGRVTACIDTSMPATPKLKPPAAAIAAATTVEAIANHSSTTPAVLVRVAGGSITMRSVQDGKQARIFVGPLRRQRPLGAGALLELGAEERLLHAAVDHVPRQHQVVRAIAIDVEVAVDAGVGDS